jgi:type I restriction enzyme S subunit
MSETGAGIGWTTVTFGDVVQLSKKRSSAPLDDGLVRYVGLEHIEPEDLKIRRWGNIADGTTFTNVFREGQVLFGKRRAYQRKVAVADFAGVCSSDIYVLEPKNAKLVPELLPFICQSEGFFAHAIQTSAGSLSPRTNWESLARYEFALPQRDAQKRIARALNSARDVDDSYEIAEEAAARLLESHAQERFDTLLNDSAVLVRPLMELIDGGVSNGIFRKREQFGTGLPLVNVTDCYKGFRVPLAQLDRVPVSDTEYPSFSAEPGDVIFNRSSLVLSGIGHACLVPDSAEMMVFECHLMRVRPRKQLLNSAFLARYALSAAGRRYILGRAQTTTMTTIGQGDLQAMPIPCPDLDTQRAIADELDAIDAAASKIRARQSEVRSLRGTLLSAIWRA